MSTPELNEPKWENLKIATLRASSEETLGFKPTSKKLKEAWNEVRAKLEKKGDLSYLCGKCNSPIDGDVVKCWACGAEITDDKDEENSEPAMVDSEVDKRAKDLGVEDASDKESAIEDAEKKKAQSRKNVDISVAEAQAINQKLTQDMPDGWRKKQSGQYTTYWDPNGVRRIAVFIRGFSVHFGVDDGMLDKKENVEFYDSRERKKRHFGRTNYVYVGDVSKKALELCAIVFKAYGKKS